MGCHMHSLNGRINGQMLEKVWKTGVRVTANKDGIVKGGEIKKRCLALVVGGSGKRGEEMRRNAKKWTFALILA